MFPNKGVSAQSLEKKERLMKKHFRDSLEDTILIWKSTNRLRRSECNRMKIIGSRNKESFN